MGWSCGEQYANQVMPLGFSSPTLSHFSRYGFLQFELGKTQVS